MQYITTIEDVFRPFPPSAPRPKPKCLLALAVVALFLFALPAFAQDSFADRLAKVESNNEEIQRHLNGISSTLARQKSDIDDLKRDVTDISTDVRAIKDVLALTGKKFVPSMQDEWGRGQPAGFVNSQSVSYASDGYSSGGRRFLFPRLRRMSGGYSAGAG
jgi:hypothetical protein